MMARKARGAARASDGRRRGILALLAAALTAAAPPDGKLPQAAAALRDAKLLWDAGQQEEALARLDGAGSERLGAHVAITRGAWLLQRGQLNPALAAARAARAYGPPTEVRVRIARLEARIQLAQQDLSAAYRAQRSAWEGTRYPDYALELMAELARAYEEGERPADALRLYRDAWQRWPLAEGSDEVFAHDQRLRRTTGAGRPPAAALVARADKLRKAYRCGEALPIYEDLSRAPKLNEKQRGAIQRGQADCLFQRRRYDEATRAYDQLLKQDPDNFDMALRRARAHARRGRTRKAVQQLEALEASSRGAKRARVQYVLVGAQRSSAPERAEKLLHVLEKQQASRGLARRASWELAWAELATGERATAIQRLTSLARGSQWDVEVRRARYWLAIAKLESGVATGKAELEELVERLPLSYYGVAAARRLKRALPVERSFVGIRGPRPSHPSVARTRWLLAAGFPELAEAELLSWLKGRRLTRTARVEGARLLQELGEYRDAVRLLVDGFGGTLEQGVDPAWREAWQLAWPRPFDASVRKAVREFRVDADLVYAVMREESTYRPEVESPAGAIGLMQIMPPTANRIARTLGMRRFRPDNLLDPETNIRFGTFYLRDLQRRFKGSPPLAIAAYNAGPDAVRGWISRNGALAEDAFVESVPYGETRRYLRRVLRSYHVYRLLYGSAQPPAGRGR